MKESFEPRRENIEQLLSILAEKLEDIPAGRYELGNLKEIEVNSESITRYEEIKDGCVFVESVTITGEYDAYVAGTGPISNDVLASLGRLEEEKGIQPGSTKPTIGRIRDMLAALEKIA